MNTFLTAKDAALHLGVSASTLKRFCASQGIQLSRTPGGHRRIDRCQLALVEKLLFCKVAIPSTAVKDIEQMVALLINADAIALQEFLWNAAYNGQRLIQVVEDSLVPAMWRIGDKWFKQEISSIEEKVCTATAALVIDNLCLRFSVPENAPVFIGATFPPSRDTIASKLVQLALRTIGIKAIDLGSNIEPKLLSEAAKRFNAVAVWVSHTHIDDPALIVEHHKTLASHLLPGCRTIIGGGGLSPSLRRLIPNAHYYESMECMLDAEKSNLRTNSLARERFEQISL